MRPRSAGLRAVLVSPAVTVVSGLLMVLLFFSELQYYLPKEGSSGGGGGAAAPCCLLPAVPRRRGGPAARGGLPCLRTPAEPPPPPPPPPPPGCPRSSFPRRRWVWGFFFPPAGGLDDGSGLPSPESRPAPRCFDSRPRAQTSSVSCVKRDPQELCWCWRGKCITFQRNSFCGSWKQSSLYTKANPASRVLQCASYSLYVTWPQPCALLQSGTFLSPWLKDSVFALADW